MILGLSRNGCAHCAMISGPLLTVDAMVIDGERRLVNEGIRGNMKVAVSVVLQGLPVRKPAQIAVPSADSIKAVLDLQNPEGYWECSVGFSSSDGDYRRCPWCAQD